MSNEAERAIRSVKVQQCSSGGSWRTLPGLASGTGKAAVPATAAPRRNLFGLRRIVVIHNLHVNDRQAAAGNYQLAA